jgi:hypothetical protein
MMNKTEQFIAIVERDAKVIEEIRQTLFVLELVDLASVRVNGTSMRLSFAREINRMNNILRMMGASDDENQPWMLPAG